MADSQYTIQITAQTAQFVAEVARAAQATQANADKIKTSLSSLETKFVSFGRGLATAVGVPLGVAGIISALDSIKDKTLESARALQQFDAVLKSTGQSAGLTRGNLEDISKGLQAKTIFSEDDIRKAETTLLQFRGVQKDVFSEALGLTTDLATRLGLDLPQAATILGKALEHPETQLKALKAAGLDLSQQNIDLAARFLEAGDKASAQRITLDALAQSIGGSAAASNTGLVGSAGRLSRAWDDLQKTFGKKLFADTTQVDKITSALDGLTDRLKTTKLGFLDLAATIVSAFTNPLAVLNLVNNSPASRTSKGKIRGLPDPDEEKAAAGKAVADAQAAQDAQYVRDQAAIRKRADSASAFFGAQLARQKAFLDAASSALDFAHQVDEVSDAAYYDRQRELANRNLQAQLRSIRGQQDAQEALAKAPSSNADTRAGAEEKLYELTAQNNLAEAEHGKIIQGINQKQALGIRSLTNEYEALNVQLLEVQGNTVDAANAAFDLSHKQIREKIAGQSTSPDPAERAAAAAANVRVEAIARLTDAQTRLNVVSSDFADIIARVGIAQQRIAIEVSTGQITELEGLNKLSAANAARIPQLQREEQAFRDLAAEFGDTKKGRDFLLQADQMKLKIEELAASTNLLADKFRDVFVTGTTNLFTDLISRTKTAKQSFLDYAKTIEQSISQIAAKNISETLFGKEGVLGGIPGFFADLFGGGTGAGVTGAAALAGSATALTASGTVLTTAGTALISAAAALTASAGASAAGSGASGLLSLGSSFFGAATGTDFAPGGLTLVGERGPEIVNLPRGAQVIPNDVLTSKRAARDGGDTYHISVNVLPGASRASGEQAAAATAREIQRSRRVS